MLKSLFSLLSAVLLLPLTALSQMAPVIVTEQTIKIGGRDEAEIYIGFAAGDQVLYSFDVLKGKEISEFEIVEYPTASKFSDIKVSSLVNKSLFIPSTGVYKIRIKNSSWTKRFCRLKVERIPATEGLRAFNTSVFWRTVHDTTWKAGTERYLARRDTTIINVTDQVAKVHSSLNLNGNKTTLNFTLPENTVSWSYYIGVDQAGQQAYEKATAQLVKYASPVVKRIPGYGPLAALALNGASYLAKIQKGEDIDFYILDSYNMNSYNNKQSFNSKKKGKVINDFSRMEKPFTRNFFIVLENDNAITGVAVSVKVAAIVVTEQWATRSTSKPIVRKRQEAYLKN